MTALAITHDQEMRQLVAERIAFRLVESTNSYRTRHFSVIDERKPVPFPTRWRYKNISGISFKPNEVAEAKAWVIEALLAGFTVFYSRTKRGTGVGHGIEHGVYSEDGPWLCEQLRARGIEPENHGQPHQAW
jgi:hypothetical protein